MQLRPSSNHFMSETSRYRVKTRNENGFTLIELLIAIAILALLVTLALPGYTQYVKQSRRSDAQHLLLLNASRLQRCFTLEGVYNGSCVTRNSSENGFYTLTSTVTTNSFDLAALPVSGKSQETDVQCGSLTYDHTGVKSATGTEPSRCW